MGSLYEEKKRDQCLKNPYAPYKEVYTKDYPDYPQPR